MRVCLPVGRTITAATPLAELLGSWQIHGRLGRLILLSLRYDIYAPPMHNGHLTEKNNSLTLPKNRKNHWANYLLNYCHRN